ncbi:D-glycero-beta-D-manno-heptose 1,7-bisphosphate 7-phosphatase [Marinimicrobium sp. ARAG 43.8]|uniref:D-glycero-beta-D-manno-heptose 1,7-bisphosphate 7-phosphatase n=1 Tax=Marinimicrobium sp. ARAG 43.8 TaxID=3418719 RepID=UPI003CFAFFCB
MKLIILDRDGVINEDAGDYIRSADECQPIPGSIEAIARLSRAGFTPVVATNQSGLARGLFDLDDLEAMHAKLSALVEEHGGKLEAIFYCPHHPDDDCKCRKPRTGMLDAMEAEFNTSVQGTWFIGDNLKDLQAALAKGCRPCLVRTGRGATTEATLADHFDEHTLADLLRFDDLASAADALLSNADASDLG